MIGTQVLFYLAVGLAGAIAAAFLLRPSYAVWMALNWLFLSTQSWDISAPRYTLMMFPLFILFARLARRRIWDAAITVWSLLWLGFFVSEFVARPLGLLSESCGRPESHGVARAPGGPDTSDDRQ